MSKMSAVLLSVLFAFVLLACTSDPVEVEVIKEVMVPGETVVVKEEVIREVPVRGGGGEERSSRK